MTARLGGVLLLLAAFLLLTLAAIPVRAEALLERTDPADGETLVLAPTAISARFSEDLDPAESRFVLRQAGETIASGGVNPDQPARLRIDLGAGLPNGTYTARWTAVALADASIAQGTFSFTVAVPEASAVPSPGVSPFPSASPVPILVSSRPMDGAALDAAVVAVTARFAFPLDPERSRLVLRVGPAPSASPGDPLPPIAEGGPDPADETGTRMRIDLLEPLPVGTYEVRWIIAAPEDAGVTRGSFFFTILSVPPPSPSP
ncbi:MAG: copper resistance protein CopC, partial [Chloroflexota bacterium]